MEQKLFFEISESDSLEDVIFRARNTIIKNRLRVDYLAIKPFKESDEEFYPNIKIATGFRVPQNRINRIKISVFRNRPLKEQTSREFIIEALEQFGSDRYMSFGFNEQRRHSNEYEFCIFESNGDQIYEVKLPSKITKKELDKLEELLEILRIPYQIKCDMLKVITKQPWKTLSYEIQAEAYLWAVENNFSPHLYSSLWEKYGYGGKDMSLSEEILNMNSPKNPNLQRIKYIMVETYSTYDILDKEEISNIEKFARQNLRIKFNNTWEVYYYQIRQKEMPEESDDQNKTRIIE